MLNDEREKKSKRKNEKKIAIVAGMVASLFPC